MKPMITISLTKEEATRLVKILDRQCWDSTETSFEQRLLRDLAELLDVKPWDL